MTLHLNTSDSVCLSTVGHFNIKPHLSTGNQLTDQYLIFGSIMVDSQIGDFELIFWFTSEMDCYLRKRDAEWMKIIITYSQKEKLMISR